MLKIQLFFFLQLVIDASISHRCTGYFIQSFRYVAHLHRYGLIEIRNWTCQCLTAFIPIITPRISQIRFGVRFRPFDILFWKHTPKVNAFSPIQKGIYLFKAWTKAYLAYSGHVKKSPNVNFTRKITRWTFGVFAWYS